MERDGQYVWAQGLLCNSLEGRAESFIKLQRYTKSLRDWDRAIELNRSRGQIIGAGHDLRLQLRRALVLVHLDRRAEGFEVANRLVQGASDSALGQQFLAAPNTF